MCKCLYRVSRLMVTSVFKFALGLNVLMASLNIVVTRYSMQILRKPITYWILYAGINTTYNSTL